MLDTQILVEDETIHDSIEAQRLETHADHVPGECETVLQSEDSMGKLSTKPKFSFFAGSLKGMILLNIGALLFGSNQVVIKVVEEVLSPATLNALRFGTASLCFLPWLPAAFRSASMIQPALELGIWLTGAP